MIKKSYMLHKFKDKIKSRYQQIYMPKFLPRTNYTNCIDDYDEAQHHILTLLETGKPCLISRFGSVELSCYTTYRRGGHPFWWLRKTKPFWRKDEDLFDMQNNAGFFNGNHKAFSKFADLFLDSAKQIDILGTWMENEYVIENKLSYSKVKLLHLEPYFAKNPWSKYLEGKKVLVVHPFKKSIESQYERKELLFDNPNILPKFRSLTVIKSVQSIGGNNCGFNDWFEALHHMEEQIDAIDYDVALIGCGAYGMPLAAHCKKKGKQAIHLGGALQLMFGIRGKRWDEQYKICRYEKMLANPSWIRPIQEETPISAQNIENACYW